MSAEKQKRLSFKDKLKNGIEAVRVYRPKQVLLREFYLGAAAKVREDSGKVQGDLGNQRIDYVIPADSRVEKRLTIQTEGLGVDGNVRGRPSVLIFSGSAVALTDHELGEEYRISRDAQGKYGIELWHRGKQYSEYIFDRFERRRLTTLFKDQLPQAKIPPKNLNSSH